MFAILTDILYDAGMEQAICQMTQIQQEQDQKGDIRLARFGEDGENGSKATLDPLGLVARYGSTIFTRLHTRNKTVESHKITRRSGNRRVTFVEFRGGPYIEVAKRRRRYCIFLLLQNRRDNDRIADPPPSILSWQNSKIWLPNKRANVLG